MPMVSQGALKDYGQQVEGGDTLPLICPSEAIPGVLCLFLGSSVHESQETAGESPAVGHKDGWGPGASPL